MCSERRAPHTPGTARPAPRDRAVPSGEPAREVRRPARDSARAHRAEAIKEREQMRSGSAGARAALERAPGARDPRASSRSPSERAATSASKPSRRPRSRSRGAAPLGRDRAQWPRGEQQVDPLAHDQLADERHEPVLVQRRRVQFSAAVAASRANASGARSSSVAEPSETACERRHGRPRGGGLPRGEPLDIDAGRPQTCPPRKSSSPIACHRLRAVWREPTSTPRASPGPRARGEEIAQVRA